MSGSFARRVTGGNEKTARNLEKQERKLLSAGWATQGKPPSAKATFAGNRAQWERDPESLPEQKSI